MQPPVYLKDNDYILCATTVADRITRIELIIDALYAQILVLAQQDEPINEYTLSDGQTHIKASYKSSESIVKAIDALTYRKNRLINNRQGRMTRGIDIKNFNGRRGFL